MSFPFKPRHTVVREHLKDLKDGFDKPELDKNEPLTEWMILTGSTAAATAYRGEFLHQLALRNERRGNLKQALRFYELSAEALSDNVLGLARTLRDYGMLIAMHGEDPGVGLDMIRRALVLHDNDASNLKGHRQRLITEMTLWRAQVIIGGDEATAAKQELIAQALHPEHDFCVRDRKVLIDFLIPRTSRTVRRELLARQAAIYAARRQPRHVIVSYVKLAVDIELSLLDSARRLIFRKE